MTFDDAKCIPASDINSDDVIEVGEVLFNNTNSTAWVGKTALFENRERGPVVCSNHITRIRPNERVSAPFLVAVLNMMQRAGYFGRLATNFNNQAGINGNTLADVVIPLGDARLRKQALAALDAAREQWMKMLADADTLLAGLNDFVLDQLALTLPSSDGRMVYAVRLGESRYRFDPDFHSPRFRTLRQKIEHGKHDPRTIKSLCNFIQSGFAAGGDDQTDDASIGIPHIRPLNISNTTELHFDGTKMVPRSDVEPGDFLQQGEVLFNNTNSTAWVGKSVVFDANRQCACSNHITRLRLANKNDSPYFLAALINALRGLGYFGLLATNFNNQAGINANTLENVILPWPDGKIQDKIAAEVAHRRAEARRLRAEAEALWEQAKADFEAALLGLPANGKGGSEP
ncbi:MAG TPA: hypothetical protein VG122_08010 [Gemmata sp.]|nr:hypothetical protein [Gemmata sp.]